MCSHSRKIIPLPGMRSFPLYSFRANLDLIPICALTGNGFVELNSMYFLTGLCSRLFIRHNSFQTHLENYQCRRGLTFYHMQQCRNGRKVFELSNNLLNISQSLSVEQQDCSSWFTSDELPSCSLVHYCQGICQFKTV